MGWACSQKVPYPFEALSPDARHDVKPGCGRASLLWNCFPREPRQHSAIGSHEVARRPLVDVP